jgi:hypothetical protein
VSKFVFAGVLIYLLIGPLLSVSGHIASVDLVQTGSDSTKRILIDVSDIVFMSSDNLSQGLQNKSLSFCFSTLLVFS